MTGQEIVTAGGPVEVAGRVFAVRRLSIAGEVGLANEFRAGAKRSWGPGGFFARSKDSFDWLASQKMMGVLAQAVAEVSRLQATGAAASDDAADEFRRSPEGVATELFWRTRQTEPNVRLEELKAVVTTANALDVHLAILAAVRGDDEGKAPTPFGSPPGS